MTINTFDKFCEYVISHINEFAPEGMEFEAPTMTVVKKTNAVYDAMVLTPKGSRLSASVNMRQLYNEFFDHPEDVFEAIFAGVQYPFVALDRVDSYDEAKKYLFIRLCSKDLNEEFLKTVPYREFHDDLVITAHLHMGEAEGSLASAAVTNDMLKHFGVDAESLFDDAICNSPKLFPAQILSMGEALGVANAAPMIVVSNTANMNGAAVLAYPGVLEEVDKRMGGTYWLMPSSIHEVIVTPDSCNEKIEMDLVVRHANHAVVDRTEWLSDRAYKRENGEWVY